MKRQNNLRHSRHHKVTAIIISVVALTSLGGFHPQAFAARPLAGFPARFVRPSVRAPMEATPRQPSVALVNQTLQEIMKQYPDLKVISEAFYNSAAALGWLLFDKKVCDTENTQVDCLPLAYATAVLGELRQKILFEEFAKRGVVFSDSDTFQKRITSLDSSISDVFKPKIPKPTPTVPSDELEFRDIIQDLIRTGIFGDLNLNTGSDGTITFNEDGTYSFEMGSHDMSGTLKKWEDKLGISGSEGDSSIAGKAEAATKEKTSPMGIVKMDTNPLRDVYDRFSNSDSGGGSEGWSGTSPVAEGTPSEVAPTIPAPTTPAGPAGPPTTPAGPPAAPEGAPPPPAIPKLSDVLTGKVQIGEFYRAVMAVGRIMSGRIVYPSISKIMDEMHGGGGGADPSPIAEDRLPRNPHIPGSPYALGSDDSQADQTENGGQDGNIFHHVKPLIIDPPLHGPGGGTFGMEGGGSSDGGSVKVVNGSKGGNKKGTLADKMLEDFKKKNGVDTGGAY